MVSKELPAPSEVLMCEASVLPYASIQRSAWKGYSAKFAKRVLKESHLKDALTSANGYNYL